MTRCMHPASAPSSLLSLFFRIPFKLFMNKVRLKKWQTFPMHWSLKSLQLITYHYDHANSNSLETQLMFIERYFYFKIKK